MLTQQTLLSWGNPEQLQVHQEEATSTAQRTKVSVGAPFRSRTHVLLATGALVLCLCASPASCVEWSESHQSQVGGGGHITATNSAAAFFMGLIFCWCLI
jgi:hypothetical protein